jgi:hypothetical protein
MMQSEAEVYITLSQAAVMTIPVSVVVIRVSQSSVLFSVSNPLPPMYI